MARFDWMLFLNEEDFKANLDALAQKLKKVLREEAPEQYTPGPHVIPGRD